jgi:hypothetical protein
LDQGKLLKRETSNLFLLWLIAVGLIIYSGFLVLVTGDIGFDGDDWWVLSLPYWQDFPRSVLSYAREFLRPVEGMYWIVLFETFGFNRVAFHLFSLLLLAASCVIMGACLSKTFPKSGVFVSLSVMFAFFLPESSCLTYLIFTDNARLSLLFFWSCVLGFQFWTGRSQSWIGLVPPVLLYFLSFLTYEAASFLIFTVPFFVWPIHRRREHRADRKFLVRLGTGIAAAFIGAVIIRFLFLNGGVVEHSGFLPSFELVWGYLAMLPFYLGALFSYIPSDPLVWVLALFMLVWTTAVVFFVDVMPPVNHRNLGATDFGERSASLYKFSLGVSILLLGMLPYQMAGYGTGSPTLVETFGAKWSMGADSVLAWFNFNEASRIYSSATAGLAILIALLVTTPKNRAARQIAQIAAVMAIGLMALFHAGLSCDWKQAALLRNNLMRSLVSQVPDVKPNTNFIFVDLESYHDRAAVIRGWAGIRSLIRMLYDDPSLGAWYIYPSETEWPNTSQQQAIVIREGFISRGMSLDHPAPHDTLLLLRRAGFQLSLIKAVTSEDASIPTGISWRGVNSLESNPDRITAWSDIVEKPRRTYRNAWTSGLISSLGLVQLTPPSTSVPVQ